MTTLSVSGIWSVAQADADALHLRVVVQRFNPPLTPEAALLVPAERAGDRAAEEVVDVHLPRLEASGKAVCPVQVCCPDSGHQPIRAVVGQLDGFHLRAESKDGQHGAENLFLRRARGVRPAREQRWREQITIRAPGVVRRQAAGRPGVPVWL